MSRGRQQILRALGERKCQPEGILSAVAALLRDLGVIRYAQDISRRYVAQALRHLDALPDNENRALLAQWAQYLVEREF